MQSADGKFHTTDVADVDQLLGLIRKQSRLSCGWYNLVGNGWILLRQHTGPIVLGELYLIVTKNFAIIRKVRSTNTPEEYRLTTLDPENFDDIIIPSKKIKKIYIVERVIVDV